MLEESQTELGESWIDQFLTYTENFPTPYLYRKWSAIGAISAALEKRVRIPKFNQRVTWPNLYIMLVGKPGSGKTAALDVVRDILASCGVKLAPKSTTGASLYDALQASLQVINLPGKMLIYSALATVVDDLGVWMSQYDPQLVSFLSEVWDGKTTYSETRRTKEIKPIENPIMNMLVGVQPAFLSNVLPKAAHDQGLLTRCLIIYTYEKASYELSQEDKPEDTVALAGLIGGLKRVKSLTGDMSFDPSGWERMLYFYKEVPGLEDEKFDSYNTRRILTIAKLSMVACAAMGDVLTITGQQVQWAIDTLLHAESFMPEAYREMGKPESAQVMAEIYSWAKIHYRKTQKPIPEHRILQAITAKAAITMVAYIWKQMVDQKYFKQVQDMDNLSQKLWMPVLEYDKD